MAFSLRKPAILVIWDGFGLAPASRGNAVTLAKMPFFNRLISLYPSFSLKSSGEAVGLSYNEPGNSEVGHLNLGAGKIVWQDLPKINNAISTGEFFKNKVFSEAIQWTVDHKSSIHLFGLASSGGTHSSLSHLYALLEFIAEKGLKKVYLHLFTDGRDTPYNSGLGFIQEVQEKIKKIGVGQIATISGRFWAMDRDNQWARVEKSYQVIASGLGPRSSDPIEVIKESYKKEVYDEELEPTVIVDEKDRPIGQVEEDDAIIFFNFRADRGRELTKAFVLEDFTNFQREKIKNIFFVTMTAYEDSLPVQVAFPKDKIDKPLAKIFSDLGFLQYHTAETQKYPHVTYFFNGGYEKPFSGETWDLVPSLPLASFADDPKMSAPQVCQNVLKALNQSQYQFIVVNFANPDMVGHTGNMAATIESLESLDSLLGEIVATVLEKDWALFFISDHGNAELIIDPKTGNIDKEHNGNPVPFIVVEKGREGHSQVVNLEQLTQTMPSGILADVAPTILKIMGLPKPEEMEGVALV